MAGCLYMMVSITSFVCALNGLKMIKHEGALGIVIQGLISLMPVVRWLPIAEKFKEVFLNGKL